MSQRAALLTKLHKVLKKHYKPVSPPADRTLLEHLLYACCLENAPYERADEAFARLQQSFFDWNEVRVSTVAELAESLTELPDPIEQATHLKRLLQAVFETHYSFDLEVLKKQNLGKSEKQLENYAGATRFVVSYGVQHGLEGHAIPIDRGALDIMEILEIITPQEAEKLIVPGLERAIPKNKGVEFGSMLHQMAADYVTSPTGSKIRAMLAEVDPNSKGRVPQRLTKPAPAAPTVPNRPTPPPVAGKVPAAPAKGAAPPKAGEKPADKGADKGKSAPAKVEAKAAPPAKGSAPVAKAGSKEGDKGAKGKEPAHGAAGRPPAGKSETSRPTPPEKKSAEPPRRKEGSDKGAEASSPTKKLAKKKPR